MAFVRSKYESDDGDIHPIKLSTLKLAKAGTPPTDAVNDNASAQVSSNKRAYGLKARYVVCSYLVGTAPNQFSKTFNIPVLTPLAYNTDTFALGASITYDGKVSTIISKYPEQSR